MNALISSSNLFVVVACLLTISGCLGQQLQACNQNDALSRDPDNCQMYMICNNGVLQPMKCYFGLVFNPDIGRCDYPYNVPNCQNNAVDPCSPNPCPAATRCVTSSSSSLLYSCQRVNITNACNANPCRAGERCVNTIVMPEGYICLLRKTGNGNACSPNPCSAGQTCAVSPNSNSGYVCSGGFNRNVCNPNPCGVNQRCTLSSNSRSGYVCTNLVIVRDVCNPNPCGANQRCSASPNAAGGYVCTGTARNVCDPNPCGANQRCTPSFTSLTGYSCSTIQRNPCDSSPCQNDGNCQISNNSFICICRLGYSGTRCQFRSQ